MKNLLQHIKEEFSTQLNEGKLLTSQMKSPVNKIHELTDKIYKKLNDEDTVQAEKVSKILGDEGSDFEELIAIQVSNALAPVIAKLEKIDKAI